MAQSLSKIYIHLIFHIKTTSSPIRESDLDRIHSYIGQLINATGCKSNTGRWNMRSYTYFIPIVKGHHYITCSGGGKT